MPVSFDVNRSASRKIRAIVARAAEARAGSGQTMSGLEKLHLEMDLTACHANGCPLRLDALLGAPDLDFTHDVWGIRRHINRRTGQLENHFLPRFADTTEVGNDA